MRAEALALFQVNQAGRTAAERVGALLATGVGLLVAAGVSAETDDVAIAFPTLALVLLSYMFQLYADVSVTGAARRVLEERLRDEFNDDGLIYEHLVAPIRQTSPLVNSVRLLQAMTGVLVAAGVGYGTYVAFDGHRWYIEIGYAVLTGAALASASLSYRDMLRAGELARERIRPQVRRT